jgi:serine/threonine protein kinase
VNKSCFFNWIFKKIAYSANASLKERLACNYYNVLKYFDFYCPEIWVLAFQLVQRIHLATQYKACSIVMKKKFIGQKLGHNGEYKILEVIGEGGFSWVFRARNTGIDQDVAIKILQPDLTSTDSFVKLFNAEAVLTARFKHANIVQVLDFFTCHPSFSITPFYCIVMEYLPGPTIKDLLEKYGSLTIEETARIVNAICEALEYAHTFKFEKTQGIIHRDIKPGNVKRLYNGDVKVLDFGIAKCMSQEDRPYETTRGTIIGSYRYMSPEQLQGNPHLTPASDIYSLGVMIFEMLTGTHPYSGDVKEVQEKQRSKSPSLLHSRYFHPVEHPSVRAMDKIISECLRYDPAKRINSAKSLKTKMEIVRAKIPHNRDFGWVPRIWIEIKATFRCIMPRSMLSLCLGFVYSLFIFIFLASTAYMWTIISEQPDGPVHGPVISTPSHTPQFVRTPDLSVTLSTNTPTSTQTSSPTPSMTSTWTTTPTYTATNTVTPASTFTPTHTGTPTKTPTPSSTFTPDPTAVYLDVKTGVKALMNKIQLAFKQNQPEEFEQHLIDPLSERPEWMRSLQEIPKDAYQYKNKFIYEIRNLVILDEDRCRADLEIIWVIRFLRHPSDTEIKTHAGDKINQEYEFVKAGSQWKFLLIGN